MLFNNQQIIQLKDFLSHIENNLIPINMQEAISDGKGNYWCADYWAIEVLRYLIKGEDRYITEPAEGVAKDNPIYSQGRIVKAGRFKINMINVLKSLDTGIDELLVCESGRGIDILLATMFYAFKKINCYDMNQHVGKKISVYFVEQLKLPVYFEQRHSSKYVFSAIAAPTIVIANQTKLDQKKIDIISNNENIKYLIFDGVLLTPKQN